MNEALAKSNKDRRSLEEKLQEAQASLNSEEDKANHLNKVKARLDATLAEVQEEVAKEKAARADSEKHRRKLEGDLKVGGGTHSYIIGRWKEALAVCSTTNCYKLQEKSKGILAGLFESWTVKFTCTYHTVCQCCLHTSLVVWYSTCMAFKVLARYGAIPSNFPSLPPPLPSLLPCLCPVDHQGPG